MILPRFYPILDTDTMARRGCPAHRAADAILEGGARILQLRHKRRLTHAVLMYAEHAARACEAAGAMFIMNDFADIAMMLGAGLHIGQQDLPPAEARRLLGADCVIGVSTHNAAQLEAATSEPVDYLAIGPIFATGSKAAPDPIIGLERLRELRRLTPRPLVAIGGITRENARAVLAAGADSVAVIGDLAPQVCMQRAIRERVEEWLAVVALNSAGHNTKGGG